MCSRIAILFLAAAALLSGCTAEQQQEAREGWERGVATGHKFRDTVLLPTLATTLEVTGDALAAYGQGVAQYEATHPTIYVQPSYVPQYQQHGTMTLMTPGAVHPFTYINY